MTAQILDSERSNNFNIHRYLKFENVVQSFSSLVFRTITIKIKNTLRAIPQIFS